MTRTPLTLMAVLAAGSMLAAQTPKRTYSVEGGRRDGVSSFPRVDYPQVKPLKDGEVDFQHFHTYEETTVLLKKWAAAYPDLVDLYSVGHSLEGRDIWQITITNWKKGKHTDKPAFFIEGGRHAGEISGIEATLYFINHVLTNYGTDPAITKLLDTKTIYAKPQNNPDGGSLYHYTAQTLRSTVRPDDGDGDDLLDEDSGEDLDGDGFIRQMRKFVGAGKGSAKIDARDPKGRLMQRVAAGQGDYDLYSEGWDNDGDGRINEDGIGGLDLHRNYPENWRPMTEETGRGQTQAGAGAYPLSEPETMAVFMFLMQHPNVAIVQSLDTAVPMILRGPSVSKSEETMFPEDLELIRKFDKKGVEITGYPWAGDTFFVYSTRNRTPAPGRELEGTPLFGHGPDFGYTYYGSVWYGNEIWNGGRMVDYDKNGSVDELEVLRWNDEHRAGKGDFQMWTKTQHPALGEVEVGGWNPKWYSQNPPPDMLEAWARNEAMFNMYLAGQLPQVKIVSASARASADGVFDVTVEVTNEGLMPTALEMAKRVKMVQQDRVTLELASGQSIVRAAGAPAQGGGRQGGPAASATGPVRVNEDIGWLKPGERKTVTFKVKGAGSARVTIGSTRGGVDSTTVEVR